MATVTNADTTEPAPPKARPGGLLEKRRQARRRRWILTGALILLLVGVVYAFRNRPAVVEVAVPETRRVVDSIAVSGRVRGNRQSDIQPPRQGVVAEVFVEEGDRVSAGQPLAQILSRLERRQVQQARAAVQVAAAQLRQVRSGPLPSEIARVRAEARQAEETARARLNQARQQLQELQSGTRAEEIQAARAALRQAQAQQEAARIQLQRQQRLFQANETDRAALERAQASVKTAQAALNSAQANVEQARIDLQRAESLFQQGAVPQSNLELARTAFENRQAAVEQARTELSYSRQELERQQQLYAINRGVDLEQARASLEAARQAVAAARAQLRLAEEGPRAETVAQARARVREAEAALQGAARAGRAQVATVESQPRPEDVAVAEARLREARQAADVAEQALAEGTVRAPYAGVIVGPVVEAGENVQPGGKLLTLVDMSRPEIRLDTDETNLDQIRLGQEAVVTADAYPDRSFRAKVTEISPNVDPLRGTVEVVLQPLPNQKTPPLKPQQTVSVNLLLEPFVERLTVPVTALVKEGDDSFVYVVRDGKAVRQKVTVGPASSEGAAILSGLSPQDRVVARVDQVKPGQRVVERGRRP